MTAATLPGAAAVMRQARAENFTVAGRLLPGAARADLLAIYGFARLVDDTGDEAAGDRLALLDRLEADVDRIYRGEPPEHPLVGRLAGTIHRRAIPREQPCALIEANRLDQRRSSYATFDDLLGYCELSANPVGRMVLHVFDAATPERRRLADAVCTGLQLTEHWQDVAEDHARGRVYIPAEDLLRFGCSASDLAGAHANTRVRALVAFEVARARDWLERGSPLIATLRGGPALAVTGFVAGGRAALAAIERADYDVLAGPPRAGRRQRLVAFAATLAQARRGRSR